MSTTITNQDDIIDSREVIERIEELTVERASILENFDPADNMPLEIQQQAWDDVNGEELGALCALAEQGEGFSDWKYGATLIRDSYLKDYAQELAEDCGMIPGDLQWPMTCIDWDKAARELKYDYSSIEFDGVTYWIR